MFNSKQCSLQRQVRDNSRRCAEAAGMIQHQSYPASRSVFPNATIFMHMTGLYPAEWLFLQCCLQHFTLLQFEPALAVDTLEVNCILMALV